MDNIYLTLVRFPQMHDRFMNNPQRSIYTPFSGI